MGNKIISTVESKVKQTIRKYKLLTKSDVIFVACSGGKDSTSVLYILNKLGYNVHGLIIDLKMGNWSDENLKNVKAFSDEHKIKLHVIDIRKELGSSMCYLRSAVQSKQKATNCMVCGTIKKWLLNKKTRELGATKIVTGHNLDDEAETILMNLFKGDLKLSAGLGPKTAEDRGGFVQRIKPLYFCSNSEIREYAEAMKFPVLLKPCPCATGSFRRSVRFSINSLEKKNPKVKENIVNTFLKVLPKLRNKYKTEQQRFCVNCGEPSRGEICKMCEILQTTAQ